MGKMMEILNWIEDVKEQDKEMFDFEDRDYNPHDIYRYGNCSFFALELQKAFGGEIHVNEGFGHAMVLIDGVLYDIEGPLVDTDDVYGYDEWYPASEIEIELIKCWAHDAYDGRPTGVLYPEQMEKIANTYHPDALYDDEVALIVDYLYHSGIEVPEYWEDYVA